MAYTYPKNLTANLVKKQVVRVEKLVGQKNKFREVAFKKKRLFDEKRRSEERERKVEDRPDNTEKQVGNKFQVPKLGFLDVVKNFLFKVLLGAFAIKLLPHLPKLKGVLMGAVKFSEFILQFSGSILNAFATFIDKAYQIVDFGKQQAKMLGGDKGLQEYNKTLNLATKVMNSMFIAGMLFSDLVESDSRGGAAEQAVDLIRDRVTQQAGQRAAQQAALRGAAQISTRAAVGIVAGVGLISSALGEGMFQLRKHTSKIEKDAYAGLAEAQKDPNLFMRFLKVGFYNTIAIPGMRFYNFISTGLGTLLDIIGAPFRYAIELINFGIMSLTGDAEGIKNQRENLGKFDARIREQIRQVVNTLSFGTLAKQQGSFGSLFGDQAVKSMGYASGGAVTRGGEVVGAVTRTVGKKVKAKRVVEIPTTPLQPGIDVGGISPYGDSKLSKIESFYANPSDPGLVNSYQYLEKSYDIVGRTKFLHPIFEISIKSLFGDKPSESDFKSVGVGLNNFFNNILDTTKVPGKNTPISDESGSFDITKWVTNSVKDSMMSPVNDILKDLMHQLTLKKNTTSEKEKPQQPSTKGEENPLAKFGGQAQFIIGDSIAHGFAGRSGRGSESDDTLVGRFPTAVLAILKARGDSLKSALIDLSTGIANNATDWTTVESQLSYLNSMGARVRILGVSNQFSKDRGGINEKLQQLATKYGFYFYGGYAGRPGDVHGTATDYAELKAKRERETAAEQTPGTGVEFDAGKGEGRRVFLHWTAGDYNTPFSAYHATILGDGKIVRNTPYSQDKSGHTAGGNTNSVGISVAAAGGATENKMGSYPPTAKQLDVMTSEVAKLAKSWGWSKSKVDTNVMTHGEWERYAVPKGILKPPIQRWDLDKLRQSDRFGSGGPTLRNMIKGKMFHGGYIKETGEYLTHEGEYVIDADSVKLFGVPFYNIINNIKTVSERKKASESLISILSQYTEDGFLEDDYTYYTPESSTVTVIPPQVIPLSGGSGSVGGGGSGDPTQDFLYT